MTRDDANWAKPVKRLEAADIAGAWNENVRGRRIAAANGGFGRLMQKTFAVTLVGATATPQEVVKTWKTHFAEFWPKGQKMFMPDGGIAPGEVGLINASVPGAPTMATGVLVIYADDESFSFMSPEGHPFAGPLTFSAFVEVNDSSLALQRARNQLRQSIRRPRSHHHVYRRAVIENG